MGYDLGIRGASKAGMHNHKTTVRPVITPTTYDLIWAAGIYEGEGSVDCRDGYKDQSFRMTVTQKDPWILNRFQQLFGGSLVRNGRGYYRWILCGRMGRELIFRFYPWLSPRRKAQAIRMNAFDHLEIGHA